jgi:hypothetical protein
MSSMVDERERELRRMLVHIDERLVAALAKGHVDKSETPLAELEAARNAVQHLLLFSGTTPYAREITGPT